MRRVRPPEEVRIELSQGDWLIVKKHLTAGEQQDMLDAMLTPEGRLDRKKIRMVKIAGYLLDWSFTDATDRPMRIREQPADTVTAALRAIDPESFLEVAQAIDAHDTAMQQARELEKNGPDGAIASSAISPSAA